MKFAKKILKEYKQITEDISVIHANHGDENVFILWNNKEFHNDVLDYIVPRLWEPDVISIDEEEKVIDISNVLYEFLSDENVGNYLIGMISTRKLDKAWNAHEVELAAAEKGYGPALYDLAISYCGVITSHRTSVSHQAERVWQYFLKQRSDVDALPFDDIEDPKTPPPEDDAVLHDDDRPALNYAYKAKRKIYDVEKLDGKNEKFVNDLWLDIHDAVSELAAESELYDYTIDFGNVLKSSRVLDKLRDELINASVRFFNTKYSSSD